jgi:hypothetical protein
MCRRAGGGVLVLSREEFPLSQVDLRMWQPRLGQSFNSKSNDESKFSRCASQPRSPFTQTGLDTINNSASLCIHFQENWSAWRNTPPALDRQTKCTPLTQLSSRNRQLIEKQNRVVYALIIINKAGGLIYQRDFADGLNKLSINDYLVLAGTFHGYGFPPTLPPIAFRIGSGTWHLEHWARLTKS